MTISEISSVIFYIEDKCFCDRVYYVYVPN